MGERPDTSPPQRGIAFPRGAVARDMRGVFGRSQPSARSEFFALGCMCGKRVRAVALPCRCQAQMHDRPQKYEFPGSGVPSSL